MSDFHKMRQDEAQVRRMGMTLLVCLLGLVGAVFAVRSGNLLLVAIAVGIPFVIPFMSNLSAIYVLSAWVGVSGISMPGMAELDLDLLFHALLVGLCFLQVLMRSPGAQRKGPVACERALFVFLLITGVLMGVRGTGLRILGAVTWGGATYIFLIVSILFFLLVTPRLKISARQVRWILWGSLVSGVVAAGLKRVGFLQGLDVGAARVIRSSWLMPFISSLLPLVLVLRLRKPLQFFLMAVCLVLMAATGFRSKLVGMGMVFGMFLFFKSHQKKQFFFLSLFCGLLFWAFLVVASPFFSPSIQRAVSFVPFTHVDSFVAQDARASVLWRFEIWKYGWDEFDKYWMVGRGVAFNVWDFVARIGNDLSMGLQSSYFAYLGHTYHSGPVTLLIDFGVPGTLCYLLFMVSATRFMAKRIKQIMHIETFEARYVLYLCVSLLWQFIAFWLVYGDSNGLAKMVMQFSLVLILVPLTIKEGREAPQQ
ncbi:MAG: O-antigen ligase family protein [Kiritimatiellales bacterium]